MNSIQLLTVFVVVLSSITIFGQPVINVVNGPLQTTTLFTTPFPTTQTTTFTTTFTATAVPTTGTTTMTTLQEDSGSGSGLHLTNIHAHCEFGFYTSGTYCVPVPNNFQQQSITVLKGLAGNF